MRFPYAILVLACSAGARTYHVDCDADPPAFQKLSDTTFSPGDSILLKRGSHCSGSLWPKGSGEPGRPIRIAAYGEGPLPVIDGGNAEAVLKLSDQQHWEVETLELTGGDPFGVSISVTAPRRHFVLRNVVIHDVGGAAKKKASGLVVLTGPLEDVLIDGITAYSTRQWAGIYVSGAANGRARDVTIRNSIVHDVDGDGIVLFRAENGRIEKSAAWRTGLQERETIGTPNGIWTWTCKNCIVEQTEGFWIDSPGVDGGVYDIDWGNDDNVVQHNYAHDAQGYCAAIFGAGKLVTTNSVIRDNVCVNNGRSPKLARRQGDIYTSTWDGGSLDGIRIERNTIVWNPPIDAPAVQMSGTEFSGSRPNVVAGNVLYSSVANLVRSGPPVRFEGNVYWRSGGAPAEWSYGGRNFTGIEKWREIAPTDVFQRRNIYPATVGPSAGQRPPALPRTGKWTLALYAGKGGPEARSQLVFLQAALAQYHDLEVLVSAEGDANLAHDWNLGSVRRFDAARIGDSPTLVLADPTGRLVREWTGFAAPADLGLTLKRHLGPAPDQGAVSMGGRLP
jgi:hypothetical protein